MIERALSRWLKDQNTVTRHVGQNIFMARRPQNTGSYAITFERFASDPNYLVAGGEAGTKTIIIRMDIWGRGRNAEVKVLEIHEALRALMSGQRWTAADKVIQGCTWENEGIDADADAAGSDYWDFSHGVDLRINYRSA